MPIEYSTSRPISAAQFIQLLHESTLANRRPVDNPACIQGMLDNASLLLTAWQNEELVGVARSVPDFYYCCYLSDLAVSERVQAQGIGKALIRQTFLALQPGCKLILLSAPQAVDYYPHIGFSQHPSAWVMSSVDALKHSALAQD